MNDMPANLNPHSDAAGYAGQTITKVPPWHGLVAWDMLLNGLTTGLFLTTAIGELLAPEIFSPLVKTAYPLAFILLLVELGCLVGDLGDPRRFHHMLRVFKIGSPMSLGTWCLTVYSLPLTVAAAVSLLDWPLLSGVHDLFAPGMLAGIDWLRRVSVICGLLPAFGSAVYKGVLISTSAQPGWKEARWLGGYMTTAAPVLGSALLLVVAVWQGEARAASLLRVSLVPLLVLNSAALLLLAGDLRATIATRYTSRQQWLLGAAAVGGGIVIPLLVLAGGSAAPLQGMAVALVLASHLSIRFAIILLPNAEHSSG